MISKCCNAPVNIVGGDEGTNHGVCSLCEQPCDFVINSVDEVIEALGKKSSETLDYYIRKTLEMGTAPLVYEQFAKVEKPIRHIRIPYISIEWNHYCNFDIDYDYGGDGILITIKWFDLTDWFQKLFTKDIPF